MGYKALTVCETFSDIRDEENGIPDFKNYVKFLGRTT